MIYANLFLYVNSWAQLFVKITKTLYITYIIYVLAYINIQLHGRCVVCFIVIQTS